MTTPLSVLLVEDSEADAELPTRELRRAGFADRDDVAQIRKAAQGVRHRHNQGRSPTARVVLMNLAVNARDASLARKVRLALQ